MSICRIVGTNTALVTRSDSSWSSTAAASNSLTMIVVAPWESAEVGPGDPADVEHRQRRQRHGVRVERPHRHVQASPPRGCGASSARPWARRSCRTCTSAARDRRPRRAPPGSTGAAAASHASYSSPTATTAGPAARRRRPRRATSRNSGPASSTGAPASVTIAVSSGAASRQFSGTATAPILAAAASSSTTSGALRSRCATREPGPAPAASRAWASRLERSSSCA